MSFLQPIQAKGEAARALLSEKLSARAKLALPEVVRAVERLLEDLRARGTEALIDYGARFDRVRLSPERLRVGADEIAAARAALPESLCEALDRAARQIRAFHEAQAEQEKDLFLTPGPGRSLALLRRPLACVGLYVPGGTAPLPSSVLMNAIPAKAAGVSRLIMCTPPRVDGSVDPLILAAAELAGVDEVYRLGGAQAVGAMAYGIAPLPAVDKICGPGNIYVNTAKRMVYGQVDIDMFAGPSEILIIADAGADCRYVARDLMSQAEHDRLASAILLTDAPELAEGVRAELLRLLERAPRREIIEASLRDYGALVCVEDLAQALELSNALAPEHLELCVADERVDELLAGVVNAGAVFCGYYSPEPLGDYWAGANHVLPTSGTARFFSPLSTGDFYKKMSVVRYARAALAEDARSIVALAEAEGLHCHAASVAIRIGEEEI